MHLADRHQAVFGLGVVNRVAAEGGNPDRAREVTSPAQDLVENALVEERPRKADQIQREQRGRPHCIDVRQRVGGGDASEVIRVVYDGREEVGRHDQGAVVG